jgi:hypothetical protein
MGLAMDDFDTIAAPPMPPIELRERVGRILMQLAADVRYGEVSETVIQRIVIALEQVTREVTLQ